MMIRSLAIVPALLFSCTTMALAQTLDRYTPITGAQRVEWIANDFIGPRSFGVGAFATLWDTAWNKPEEWKRSWSGVGKRYLSRETDVAISDSLEAGLGAIWGEDPRYINAPRGSSVRSRVGYAFKTVLLAPRGDGRLAPAWARMAGNTVNNVIENRWLPPSATTPTQTVLRSGKGLLGRLAANLFEEFWPDITKRLRRRP